jgi:transposase
MAGAGKGGAAARSAEKEPFVEENAKYQRQSREFIESVIKLVKVDQVPVAEVSQRTGIRRGQIYRWLAKHDLEQARKHPGSDASLRDEAQRLRKENELLKKQVDFLKKAATYFASQNNDDSSSSGSTLGSAK